MKYALCDRAGYLIKFNDGTVKLNESRFLETTSFVDFRTFEDESSFRTPWDVPEQQKLKEVERFLSKKVALKD